MDEDDLWDSSDGELSLIDSLYDATVLSQFEKTPRQFIPQGALESIITRDAIHRALYGGTDSADEALIDYIVKDARKLFAVTVLTGLEESEDLTLAMRLFRDHNFSDRNFPIESPSISEEGPSDLSAHPCARLGKPWSRGKIRTFCREQWKLLVPVFLPDGVNHDLGVQIIPFIDKSDKAREGSSGSVRRYTVHPDHIQGFATGGKAPSNIVAVKEIREQYGHGWAAEVKALAHLNTLNQDHIVRFITAFRRRLDGYEEQYLMFEWADGGNLQDLWVSIPEPKLQPALIKAALIQLTGLAKALRDAHYGTEPGSSYCHGDLKPEHIWWYSDGTTLGKLKIGGWSEAKSLLVNRKLWPGHGATVYETRLYKAPEVVTGIGPTFLGQATHRRSRLSDIWSMGCITLEFVIWLLYGVQGLNEFNHSIQDGYGFHPAFYQIRSREARDVAEVHKRVIHWMNIISKDSACRHSNGTKTALGDVLDIVRDKLLVVKLPATNHDPRSLAVSTLQESGAVQDARVPSITVTLAQPNEPDVPSQIRTPMAQEPTTPTRATAIELCQSLASIMDKADQEGYWVVGQRTRPSLEDMEDSEEPVSEEGKLDTEDAPDQSDLNIILPETSASLVSTESTNDGERVPSHSNPIGPIGVLPETCVEQVTGEFSEFNDDVQSPAQGGYHVPSDTVPSVLARDENMADAVMHGPDQYMMDQSDSIKILPEASVLASNESTLFDTFSQGTTAADRKYKTELALFLADNARLRPWYRRLLDEKGEEPFVNIAHDLLEGFHKHLLTEVTSERQEIVVGFLRSSKGRYRMGEDIRESLTQDSVKHLDDEGLVRDAKENEIKGQEEETERKKVLEQLSMGRDKVQAWSPEAPDTEGFMSPEERLNPIEEMQVDISGKSIEEDASSSASSEDPNLKNIDDLKEFLLNSEAFRALVVAVQVALLPRSLQSVLRTVPQDRMWLSRRQNRSWINYAKGALEDFTQLPWNWWPLNPRMRELQGDEERLFWYCACGSRLWREVKVSQAQVIRGLLPELKDRPLEPHLCMESPNSLKRGRLLTLFAASHQPNPTAQSPSVPAKVHLSPATNQNVQTTSSVVPPTGTSSQSQHPQSGSVTANKPSTSLNAHGSVFQNTRVVFGVQGDRQPVLEIDQIRIDHQMTDMTFYRELKYRYKIKRGFMRFWFSIWRLGHCEPVQFKRSSPQWVFRLGLGLPAHQHPDYLERTPHTSVEDFPITSHEFATHLQACHGPDPCRWAMFHNCSTKTDETDHLKCLPQKKSEFDIATKAGNDDRAWGLDAVLEISAAYMAFYHVVILALPFGFWGWWQSAYPDDLQNASVPVTVALTMLSLFWGANGILTQGK